MKYFKNIIIPISMFFISITIYFSTCEIEELVRGTGKIISQTENRSIQHFEGGILEKLFVIEGEKISKGQKLLKIKNTFFNTSLSENKKLQSIYEERIRILTSLIENKEYKPSDVIFFKLEYNKYKEEKNKIKQTNSLLLNNINEKKLKIRKDEISLINLKNEKKIIKEDFDISNKLFKNNSISKKEYLKNKLKLMQTNNEIEELKNNIPILKKQIITLKEENELKIKEIKIKWINEINKINEELIKKQEQIKSLLDRKKRMIIYSPIEGIINKINFKTIGSTIEKGKEILDIIPKSDNKIVEGEVLDRDRGKIWVGQKVNIELNAYPSSKYGYLKGEIIYISADSYIKKNNEKVFYNLKIKIKENNKIQKNKILNGMTVNVNIKTGKKTIMEYIIKPLKYIKDYSLIEQ